MLFDLVNLLKLHVNYARIKKDCKINTMRKHQSSWKICSKNTIFNNNTKSNKH